MKKRLSKQEKVKKYLGENKVFPISSSQFYEKWGVEGTQVYTVTFDKLKESFLCNCENVRTVDCAHICCVKKVKGIK